MAEKVRIEAALVEACVGNAHGIPLLRHALAGGEAAAVAEYLQSLIA